MVELPNHPWFLASQFHPEFTSNPRDGHPLFKGYIAAVRKHHVPTTHPFHYRHMTLPHHSHPLPGKSPILQYYKENLSPLQHIINT